MYTYKYTLISFFSRLYQLTTQPQVPTLTIAKITVGLLSILKSNIIVRCLHRMFPITPPKLFQGKLIDHTLGGKFYPSL